MYKSIIYGKNKTKNSICAGSQHFSLKLENMTWSCLEAVSMVTAQPASSTSGLK